MGKINERQFKNVDNEVLSLEKSLENFILNYASSLTKLELIRFFAENTFTCSRAEGIASYVGRKTAVIEKELKSLSKSGLIDEIKNGELSAYCYTSDEETQKKVEFFLENLNDRTTRLKIISKILKTEAERDVL
ncbi:MAG TPA: hypothetical protein ENN38_06975 [Actinobacteria bacterium]|nr:hypothetical protein [Actinomycetota bacterium]